jgi:hypothetical protein
MSNGLTDPREQGLYRLAQGIDLGDSHRRPEMRRATAGDIDRADSLPQLGERPDQEGRHRTADDPRPEPGEKRRQRG